MYLIEVNPRASRTVPFLSKVTGVPMVELAVRISLGASLAGLGWPGGLLPPAAVRGGQGAGLLDCQAAGRRPVAWARSCSRRARSSGSDRTRASPWPRRSPARRSIPPRAGRAGALALLSIADRDKGLLARAGGRAASGPATARRDGGHAGRARALGHDGSSPWRSWAPSPRATRPRILDLIASGQRPPGRQHAHAAVGCRCATRPRSGTRRSRRGSSA